jgi:sulfide:quinone oxidoreductase
MDLKKLTKDVAVSPQISAADLISIQALGYSTVVCHRPDGEEADQVKYSEIENAARALNLKTIYQPVVSGKITDADVVEFKSILNEAQGPVFAYCRTGTRCTMLWSLAVSDQLSVSEILLTSKNAGYDMSALAERIANDDKEAPNKHD